MAFDFEKLENAESRVKFNQMMETINCAQLDLSNYLIETSYEDRMARLMMTKTKALVRVYLIEGFDFAQRDVGSYSDPYIVTTCGKKVYSERDNY